MSLARELLALTPWAIETPEIWLESTLSAQLAAAREALPELPIASAEFVRYLAEHLPEGVPLGESLARVRVAELYLAFGCLRGLESALQRLDADFLSKVRLQGAAAQQRDDVLQQVRARLLVAEPGVRSKLWQYRGDGPLLAWLQMTATRLAIENARKAPRAALERRAFSDPDLVVDPELDFLKLRYAEHFQRCLNRALSELPTGDATLLKLCYLNRAPPSALAALYSVSTRTVQRRIAEVRERILELTRGYLQAELALEPNELESLLALVQGRLHLSLRHLGNGESSPTPRS